MLHKALTIEDMTAEGEVTAVVATMGVKDKDGDVTLPGFFGTQPTRMVWGHQRHVWLGKGLLQEDAQGQLAVFTGQFFMDTQAGSEAFKAVKGMGELAEWSYGFRLLDGGFKQGEFQGEQVRFLQPRKDGTAGVIVDEVSPVLIGAGEGTHTVAIKGWHPGDPLPDTLTLADHIKGALGGVDAVALSVTALHSHLTEQGHTLSDGKRAVLAELVDGLKEALAVVQPVLEPKPEGEEKPATSPDDSDPLGMSIAHSHLAELLAGLPQTQETAT